MATIKKKTTEKLQLFHESSKEPWAELETTLDNRLRVTYHDFKKKDAPAIVITITRDEADQLHDAIDQMSTYYMDYLNDYE